MPNPYGKSKPNPRPRLLASAAKLDDPSHGGVIAETLRYLANAAPTATGVTIFSPDGSSRYFSRAEAEAFVFGPKEKGARQ